MAVETDEWRRLRAIFQTIHDETVDSANTAARIGDALLALLPYIGAYIRKDQPDSTNYLLTLLAGAVIGNSAIHLNPDGSIECGSLSVKGSAIFDEIISNHQSVLEGDTYFTNKHTVEHVEDLGFGNYRLTFRKEYENDIVTYRVGDILRQSVNNLDKKRTYYNTWSRVTSVDLEANTADVLIYQDSEVDGGKNYPPEEGYLSIRWGNNVDKERQSLWLLSSTYKRLEHHWNVDQPILRPDNYALCLGVLPSILDDAGILPSTRDKSMPSLYINSIFYEHAHHIYYPSQVVKVDRGQWTASPTATYTGVSGTYDGAAYNQGQAIAEPYHCESFSRNMWLTHRLSPAHANLTDEELLQKMTVEWHVDKETSRAWRYGCLWECRVDGTTEEPGFSPDWVLVSGQGARIGFDFDHATLVWVDDVALRAEARILIGTADATDDLLDKVQAGTLDVVWTWNRIGNADGTQNAADKLWSPTTETGNPNVLLIDHKLADDMRRQDCGPLWESLLRVVFSCTARLSTGGTATGELGLG